MTSSDESRTSSGPSAVTEKQRREICQKEGAGGNTFYKCFQNKQPFTNYNFKNHVINAISHLELFDRPNYA